MQTINYQKELNEPAQIIAVPQGTYGLAGNTSDNPIRYIGTFGVSVCTAFALVARNETTGACRVALAHCEAFAGVQALPSKMRRSLRAPEGSSLSAYITSMANTKHTDVFLDLMKKYQIPTYVDTGNQVSSLVIDLNSGLAVDPSSIPEDCTLIADPTETEFAEIRVMQAMECALANMPDIFYVMIQQHFDADHGVPENYRPTPLQQYLDMKPF